MKWIADVLSIGIGFLVCFLIMKVTGRKEAWDSGAYFSLGIPIMVVAVAGIAYRFPDHPMRWAFVMALGQSFAMVFGGGSLNLWPLSIVAMVVCSVPQFVAASIAAKLSKRKMKS